MSEFWKTHIWWWAGAHGTHIRSIGLIPMDSTIIGKDDSPPESLEQGVLAVPIDATRKLASGILSCWYSNKPRLASMAGIMTITTPSELAGYMSSFHLLWWPTTPNGELKLVRATDGADDHLSHRVVQNAQDKWIRILELSRIEHDKAMAFHQALTHVAVILHDSTPWVVKIAPGTSPQIITEMIQLNPFFKKIWDIFLGLITEGRSLWEAYLTCMQEVTQDASTTNSSKQMQDAKRWNIAPDEQSLRSMNWAISTKDTTSIMALIKQSRQ